MQLLKMELIKFLQIFLIFSLNRLARTAKTLEGSIIENLWLFGEDLEKERWQLSGLPDLDLYLPESFQKIAFGKINFIDNIVWGLNSTTFKLLKYETFAESDGFIRINFKIQLHFPIITVTAKHDVNLGFYYIDFPINFVQGTGDYWATLENVNLEISGNVKTKYLSRTRISDLDIKFFSATKKFNGEIIDGFRCTKSSYKLVEMTARFLKSTFSKEIYLECFDCILSKSLEYLINGVLNANYRQPDIQCPCLEQLFPFSLRSFLEYFPNVIMEDYGKNCESCDDEDDLSDRPDGLCRDNSLEFEFSGYSDEEENNETEEEADDDDDDDAEDSE